MTRAYRLFSGKSIGMPKLFGGKHVPIRTNRYVESGLKALERLESFGRKHPKEWYKR